MRRGAHANEVETFYVGRLKGKKITALKISILTFVIGRDNKLLYHYRRQETSGRSYKSPRGALLPQCLQSVSQMKSHRRFHAFSRTWTEDGALLLRKAAPGL